MTATVRRIHPASARRGGLLGAASRSCASAAALARARAAHRPRRSARPSCRRSRSCASLVSYAHRNARRTGGRTGVPTRAGGIVPQVLVSPGPGRD